MKENITTGLIAKTLDWAYTKAVVGFTGVDSAYELADSYLQHNGSLDKKVNSLIKWQVAKSGTSGFLAGFGGLVVMPFTVPVNLASVLYVQIRMIAAIAHMNGHDLRSDQVKSMVYICMVGNGAKELFKDMSLKTGEKFLTEVSQKVSYKLVTKFGEMGVENIGKLIPLMGGLIGGTFDAVSTKIVGSVAKKAFVLN